MTQGMIFDIKEFAVHDGPGIRTTVFFKGCPLRCAWCHNPEGISFEPELMVSGATCTDCGKCREVCEHEVCTTCGKCVEVCPRQLRKISGQVMQADDVAKELLKNRKLLKENNNGITISGGEPLAQPEFLIELLEELESIHIAVDTSGYAPVEIFRKVVELADMILFDVKQTDPEVHRKITGVDNKLIIENLNYLTRGDTEFIVRIPLLPGLNDTKENMQNIAGIIKGAKALVRVDFLPYHKTAGAKYPMLGKRYNPGFDEDKNIRVHKEIFDDYNIKNTVL
jgi:pyruvate formate lyase activating enzyme